MGSKSYTTNGLVQLFTILQSQAINMAGNCFVNLFLVSTADLIVRLNKSRQNKHLQPVCLERKKNIISLRLTADRVDPRQFPHIIASWLKKRQGNNPQVIVSTCFSCKLLDQQKSNLKKKKKKSFGSTLTCGKENSIVLYVCNDEYMFNLHLF